jgi:hypothetical protein
MGLVGHGKKREERFFGEFEKVLRGFVRLGIVFIGESAVGS